MIVGTLKELGITNVEPYAVAKCSIPVAVISIVVSVIRNYMFDKSLRNTKR